MDFSIEIVPRFDYGAVDAWIRTHGQGVFTAIGGDDGLLIGHRTSPRAIERTGAWTLRNQSRTHLGREPLHYSTRIPPAAPTRRERVRISFPPGGPGD